MNICYVIWLLLVPSLISLILLIIAMYSESWLIAGAFKTTKTHQHNLDLRLNFLNTNDTLLSRQYSKPQPLKQQKTQLQTNLDITSSSEVIYSIPHVKYESLFGLCINYENIKFDYETLFEKYIDKLLIINKTTITATNQTTYKCEDLNKKHLFKNNFLYCNTINGKSYLVENHQNNNHNHNSNSNDNNNNNNNNYINCKPICDPLYSHYCPKITKTQCITNTCINDCFLTYYTTIALHNPIVQLNYKIIIAKLQLNTCITNCFKIMSDCTLSSLNTDNNSIKQISFSGILFNIYTNQKTQTCTQNPKTTAGSSTGNTMTNAMIRSSIINNNANNNEILYDELNKCHYYKYNLFNVFTEFFNVNVKYENLITFKLHDYYNSHKYTLKYLNLLPKLKSSNTENLHEEELQTTLKYHNLNDIFYSIIITLLFLTIFFHIITIFLLPLLFLCNRNSTCLLFIVILHIIFVSITFVFNFSSLCIFFINSLIKNEILYSSVSSGGVATVQQQQDQFNAHQSTNIIAKKLLFDLKLNSINLFINYEIYGYAFYLACVSNLFTFINFIIACINLYFFKRKIYDNLPYGSYDLANTNNVKYFSYL